jgi:response regulator RpfG family c-di-GMP phosphodiesterase
MKNAPRFILLDDDLFTLTIEHKVIRNYYQQAEIISFSACKDAIQYMEAESFKGEYPVEYPETIFLTDLHMPETDGFELLDRMENTCKAMRERLHIFVLSGAACPDEIRRVLSYKCVAGFYNKPLCIDKMSKIITRVQYPF